MIPQRGPGWGRFGPRQQRRLQPAPLRILLGVLALLSLASTRPETLLAAGGKDLEDGWLVPVARILDLLPPGGSVRSGSQRRGVWFQAGMANLYGMAELPLQQLATGLISGKLTGILAWQALGQGLYREERFLVRLVFGGAWKMSIAGGRCWLAVNGDPVGAQSALGLALRSPVTHPITLQVAWQLLAPPTWHDGRGQQRWCWLSGRFGDACWAVTLDRSENGVPSFQTEILLALTAGFAWGARAEPATGSLGFITVWRRFSLLVRSSHLAHPELGLTHRWSVSLGVLDGIW